MAREDEVIAQYGYTLAANTLIALVVSGVIPKEHASTLVTETLGVMLSAYPDHEPLLRNIAGAHSTAIGMAVVERDRQMRKP